MKRRTIQALLRCTGSSLSSSSLSLASVKRVSFSPSFPSQTLTQPHILTNPCLSRLLGCPRKPNSFVLSYSSFPLRFVSTNSSSSSSSEDIGVEANEEEEPFQCKLLFPLNLFTNKTIVFSCSNSLFWMTTQ